MIYINQKGLLKYLINDYTKLNRILSLISDNGFTDELVLMGSQNEYFYERIYDSFVTNMATQDIDFYCLNRNRDKRETSLNDI